MCVNFKQMTLLDTRGVVIRPGVVVPHLPPQVESLKEYNLTGQGDSH